MQQREIKKRKERRNIFGDRDMESHFRSEKKSSSTCLIWTVKEEVFKKKKTRKVEVEKKEKQEQA